MTDKIPEEVKWIKISTGLFEDEAIQIILDMPDGAVMLEIWLRLLIMAGKVNDRGLIYLKKNENLIIPFSSDFLATLFHKKNKQIEFSLKTFEKFGMIKILNANQILISNWEKYQNYDQMEKIRQKNNERQKRYRERQKALQTSEGVPLLPQNNNVTCNVTHNADVTASNGTDIDIELELDKELDTCNGIICCCSEEEKITPTSTPISEPVITTQILNEDQKLYGEFGNVCLSQNEYGKLLGITLSQKLLDQVIEELSQAIGIGKYEQYRADCPNAHYILLRKFIDWHKKHPDTEPATSKQSGFKTKNQEIQEVQDEVDRVIEELKKKEQGNGTK